MIQIIKKLATGLVLTLFSQTVSAFTLEQFWRETVNHDPQIRVYRQRLEAASQAQPLALAELLPHISLQSSEQWDQHSIQKPYDKYIPDSVTLFRNRKNLIGSWSVQIRQALFNWSALQEYLASNDQVAAAAAQYQQSLQSLERNATVAYTNWLLAYANLQSVKASEKGVARQAFDAEARYRSGTTGILGVEETKDALGQVQAQLAKAKANWQASTAKLEQFSGSRAPLAAPPLPRVIFLPSQPIQKWKMEALMHNPALSVAHFQLASARKGVSAAWGEVLPHLSLVLAHQWRSENGALGYQYGLGPGSQYGSVPGSTPASSGSGIADPHKYIGSSVALELNWPIFSGGSQQASLAQAQYRAEENFSILQETQLTIIQELRSAFSGLRGNLQQADIYRDSLITAERASTAAENGVGVGLVNENNAIIDRQNALAVSKSLNGAIASAVVDFANLALTAGELTPSLLNRLSVTLSADEKKVEY